MIQNRKIKRQGITLVSIFYFAMQGITIFTTQGWASEAAQIKPIFTTDRLSIQSLREADRNFLIEHWSQKEVSVPAGLGELEPYQIKRFVNGMYYGGNSRQLMIYLKDINQPIGDIQMGYLGHFREALGDIASVYRDDILKKNAVDVGYSISPKFWRQGYATEVVNGVVNQFKITPNIFFPEIKVGALTANISPENTPSISLVLKCHFVLYGPEKSPYGRQLYVYDFSKENTRKGAEQDCQCNMC